MGAVGSADIYALADALRQSAGESQITTQGVLVQSANYLKADMESRVPVRTGRLKQSIQIRIQGQDVIIGPNTEYAAFVEFGTKPHDIVAKNKKALMFWMGGRQVIVKKVHHPGSRAKPFVRPAFDDWVDTLGGLVAEAHVQKLGQDYRQR